MVTLREIEEHVARFTYKPGWEFKITPGLHPMEAMLSARYWAQDSDVPPARLPEQWQVGRMRIDHPLTPIVGQERMDLMLLDQMYGEALHTFDMIHLTPLLKRSDQHEMEEWLRYDGRRIVDPHPK